MIAARSTRTRAIVTCATAAAFIILLPCVMAPAQEPNPAQVIQQVDASVAARVDSVLGFTDTEHYSVYRGNDQSHPVAEMTVRDTYKKASASPTPFSPKVAHRLSCASD